MHGGIDVFDYLKLPINKVDVKELFYGESTDLTIDN